MSWRAALLWIAGFCALALFGTAADRLYKGIDRRGHYGPHARVVRVIDGDTVRVRVSNHETRTVRYIGVDTPESVKPGTAVECYAERASAFNRRLVDGHDVRLRFGAERTDRYGRLLAYVYPEGARRSASATLIARGYGRLLAIAPNTAHIRAFSRLERRARRLRRGLWGACQ